MDREICSESLERAIIQIRTSLLENDEISLYDSFFAIDSILEYRNELIQFYKESE